MTSQLCSHISDISVTPDSVRWWITLGCLLMRFWNHWSNPKSRACVLATQCRSLSCQYKVVKSSVICQIVLEPALYINQREFIPILQDVLLVSAKGEWMLDVNYDATCDLGAWYHGTKTIRGMLLHTGYWGTFVSTK